MEGSDYPPPCRTRHIHPEYCIQISAQVDKLVTRPPRWLGFGDQPYEERLRDKALSSLGMKHGQGNVEAAYQHV